MNATSRNPRPHVVDKKIVRPGKKGPTVKGNRLQDNVALQRALTVANHGREGHDRISDNDLAQYARPLGGAKNGQQWMDYRNGNRRIPPRDKLIAALFLHKAPEEVFPSWEKPILPMLMQVIAFAAQLAISHDGQESLGKLLQGIAGEGAEHREALLRKIRDLLDR
jgi:hypothetical protein